MRSPLAFRTITLFFAAALPAVLAGHSARAAETTPAEPANDDRRGLTGLELTLRPAVGAAASDSPVRLAPGVPSAGRLSLLSGASPYGPGLVATGMLGYRFLPFFSAGARLGIRQDSAAKLADAPWLNRSAFDVGVYARVYPLATRPSWSRYVDPWISTGLVYMRDNQAARTAAGTEALDHFAVGVPIGIGLDWRVLPQLAIGPSFEYEVALGGSGCDTIDGGGRSSTVCTGDAPRTLEAKVYGVWSTGIDLRVTF